MKKLVIRTTGVLVLAFASVVAFSQSTALQVEAIRRTTQATGTRGSVSSAKALEVLTRSMQRVCLANVIAIMVQNGADAETGPQRVKLERAKDGRVHHTVLAPLRLQGIESVDNGDFQFVYWPDQKTVIQQDSSLKVPCDAPERVNLAARNYVVTLETKGTVAGRKTVCVTAVPKHSQLTVRRYYIDVATYYPLKLETVDADGPKTVFEAKDVQYPRNMADATFKLATPRGTNVVRYSRPRDIRSLDEAKEIVGFSPIAPTVLPFGFELQDLQVKLEDSWKPVMLRLTDGLVRATVYQWRSDGKDLAIKSLTGKTMGEVNGIQILVVSDQGPEFRTKLLESFIKRGSRESSGKLLGMLVPGLGEFPGKMELQDWVTTLQAIQPINLSRGSNRKARNG